jgi:hypothetical protein
MKHSAQSLVAALCCLVVAACGGSTHTTTTTSATATSSTSPAVTSTSSSPNATTSTETKTTATQSPSASHSSGGSTNVRVPATFVILAGGKLQPPQVSAPAFLAVQVSVASADGKGHRVVLKTPVPRTLSVPAHGHVSILVPGLKAGMYAIDVDGVAAGALSIGGEPGP